MKHPSIPGHWLHQLFVLILLLSAGGLHAQFTVSGQVTEAADGTPLIGVSVVERGTTNGTVTDLDGNFSLEVSTGEATLIMTYVGYALQEVALAGRSQVDIALSEGVNLDEVVVTALGLKREKKALGYAVEEVSGDEIDAVRPVNMLSGLSGKVAGLTVTNASNGLTSSSRVVIRGENSLNINANGPLVVVDGIPINNEVYGVGGGSTSQSDLPSDYGNGAAEINPADIASVSVLKGAAASALYGSRAANGVLLITTKSGETQKGLGINFSSNTTWSSPLVLPDQQTQYGGGWGLAYASDFGTNFGPSLEEGLQIEQDGSPQPGEQPFVRRYDIADFFQTGFTTTNQLAINGGSDRGNFRLSYGNSQSEGIVPNTDLDRHTISLNTEYRPADWLTIDLSGNYINSGSNNVPVSGYGSQGLMYVLLWNYNNADMDWFRDYWAEGGEDREQTYIFTWADNPYLIAYENLNGFEKDRLFGRISATAQLTPELSLLLRGGTDYFDDLRTSRRPVGAQRYANGMYREQNVNFRETNLDFLLTYTKRFGDFSAVVSGGGNRREEEYRENFIEGRGLAVPGIYNLQNINVNPTTRRILLPKRVNSLYAFANLGYRDFLYLDVTARNDWSSALPEANNSYFYPSASLSFLPSEIFDLGEAVDYVKLRANVAQVGNDTRAFSLVKTYEFATLPNSVSSPSELPNAELKPERTNSYEVGLTTELLERRLRFDFTYYNSVTSDQIIRAGISPASGFNSTVVNAGEVETNGLEAALGISPFRNPDGFSWDLNVNFTRSRSVVNALAPGIETFIVANGPDGTTVEARVGGRMGDIYGQVFNRTEDGQVIYGTNGLPEVSTERQSIGNYNPDFTVGMATDVSYRGVFAHALLDIRSGGRIYSYTNAIGAESGLLQHSLPGRTEGLVGDGVMRDDDGNFVENTTVVAPETWYYGGYYRRDNVEANSFDASFAKLREVTVGYRLPQRWLQNIGVANASIAFVGQNVALWTDVPNIDPEAFALNGGTLVPGFEVTQLPSTKSFGFRLNLGF
ncbi:SusC/RagA family TonB-linked outer membrane protein [Lewinella sp. IMCC34191]|uniref:SusC/RagA family TonB-linked outer membrane protein n=1 Tax=Lewinella sp. IMCC34191 TaxID=2259172 RepID=UPI0013009608|nr:SusC/RagA family TonB-linked outer membrane protein [Lewinella sp. IMCC34191]